MRTPELSIILPCYNEGRSLPLIVERLARFWPSVRFELIFVNNGSTDNTAEVLKYLTQEFPEFIRGVTVLRNIGYGHGILAGLKEAKADLLAYSHADIQTPPEDIIKSYQLYESMKESSQRILIKGLRTNRRKEDLFLTRSLARVAEAVLGYPLEDINGQPKLFPRQILNAFKAPPQDFTFDLYLLYVAMLEGYQLITFPVDFGKRIHGQSKWSVSLTRRYKTVMNYLINIFKIALSHSGDSRNLFKQLTRFLTTGILTNFVNYSVFWLSLRHLNQHYLISSTLGFGAGFFTGFVVNRSWTFSSQRGRAGDQLIKFFIVNIISLAVNLITIRFFTERLHVIPEISQLLAIAVSAGVNFAGCKFWAFSRL